MMIKQLIAWVELHDNEKQHGKHSEPALAIIAALNAGQTLAYKAEAYLNLTNPGWSRPQKELTEAINAWDAAVGKKK